MQVTVKSGPGLRNRKCKGPEVGVWLLCLRKPRGASMVGAEQVRGPRPRSHKGPSTGARKPGRPPVHKQVGKNGEDRRMRWGWGLGPFPLFLNWK